MVSAFHPGVSKYLLDSVSMLLGTTERTAKRTMTIGATVSHACCWLWDVEVCRGHSSLPGLLRRKTGQR